MRTKAIHTLLTMMMVAAIIMVWTHATQAEMLVTELAYELNAGQVALPGNDNGTVTIRTCPECNARLLRVDAQTAYFLGFSNAPALSRRAFVEAVAGTLADDDALYIFYRADSTVVTRIVAGVSDQ